jgi:hypothetical protein
MNIERSLIQGCIQRGGMYWFKLCYNVWNDMKSFSSQNLGKIKYRVITNDMSDSYQ